MKALFCLLISVLMAIPACSPRLKPLTETGYVTKIKEGQSTKAEVKDLLGAPAKVNFRENGGEVWVYTETQVRPPSFVPTVGIFAGGTSTLAILFNSQGIVETVGTGKISVGGSERKKSIPEAGTVAEIDQGKSSKAGGAVAKIEGASPKAAAGRPGGAAAAQKPVAGTGAVAKIAEDESTLHEVRAPGTAFVNKPLTQIEPVTKIKADKTTKAEVRGLLGAPAKASFRNKGAAEVWEYSASQLRPPSFVPTEGGIAGSTETLVIVFNNQGVVQNVDSEKIARSPSLGMRPLTEAGMAAKIKEGKSTKAEVKDLLGKPAKVSSRDDGAETWEYLESQVRPPSLVPTTGFFTKDINLVILFDNQGIVQKVGTSKISGDGESGAE